MEPLEWLSVRRVLLGVALIFVAYVFTRDAYTMIVFLALGLMVWQVLARRNENDLWAGITTTLLIATAVLVPMLLVLQDDAGPTALWLALALAIGAAWIASTEWLRRSLRIFALLAIVVLGTLTIRVGLNEVAEARCDRLSRLGEDLKELEATSVDDAAAAEAARQDANKAATKVADASISYLKQRVTKGARKDVVTEGPPTRQWQVRRDLVEAAQALLVGIETQRQSPATDESPEAARRVQASLIELDRRYAPAPAVRAERKLVKSADRALTTLKAERAVLAADPIDPKDSSDAQVALKDAAAGCQDTPRERRSHLDVLKAEAAIATYREAVDDATANKEAAKKAVSARDDLSKSLSQNEPDPAESWTSTLQKGAEAAGASALSWLPGSPEVDRWFWISFALVLLAWWWLIERRSNAEVAGPIMFTFIGVDEPANKEESSDAEPDPGAAPAAPNRPPAPPPLTKDVQTAIFASALTKNFREPGTTPGSKAASPVTDLEGLVTAGPTGFLTSLLTALSAVLNAPRGSVVVAQTVTPTTGEPKWHVWTQVSDASTGQAVASKEVEGRTPADACRAAGYWAAATLLNASPRFPVWSRWSPTTAEAFATYEASGDLPVAELKAALAQAPASGLMLQKLADLLCLKGDYIGAAELYARAVTVDRTFDNAVYRLGAALSALSHERFKEWTGATQSNRMALLAALERACERLDLSFEFYPNRSNSDLDGPDFRELARSLFEHLERQLRGRSMLIRSFRRDQREKIGPLVDIPRPFGARGRLRYAVHVAALTVQEDQGPPDERTLAFANKPQSGWHVCYNLACFYALADDPDEAIRWLELAITRPGVEELTREWLASDPDLKSLRDHPRFDRVRLSLPTQTEDANDA